MEHSHSTRLDPPIWDYSYHSLRQLATAIRAESRQCSDGLLVDLGCGEKPYEPLFGARTIGIDRTYRHGDPDVVGFAEALPVRDGSASTVLSTQSLEHAEGPAELLDEAHRILEPGGTLLLSTHGVFIHHPDPHDYWRWTEEGLTRLFESRGFEVLRVHHQGEVFLTGLLLAAYPIGAATFSKNPVVRLAAQTVTAAINLAGFVAEVAARLLPRHYSSITYLVVARKPA